MRFHILNMRVALPVIAWGLLAVTVILPRYVYAQTVVTVAGNGTAGYSGDGGAATAAELNTPWGVAVDGSGNIIISDYQNSCIRKVNTAGIISTIAGNGTPGYSGDGLAATLAELKYPTGVAVDASGNIYVADRANNCVRKISSSGIISTFAGTGVAGFGGDGTPATAALLNEPAGVCLDGSGNVLIADENNHRIRKVNSSGIITTFAGTGADGFGGDGTPATGAAFSYPIGVNVDASGNVFVADYSNHRIRKINTSGIISTFAGSATIGYGGDGGPATLAYLFYPIGTVKDPLGYVYIADNGNSRIRIVDGGGIINTITGSANPTGVACDARGNIYISEYGSNLIRRINCDSPATGTITGPSYVCTGATINLTDALSGGVWSSSNGTATIAGGLVTGMSAGIDTISYSFTNACATASATAVISVIAPPTAGPLMGIDSVCAGKGILLTDVAPGGSWSVVNANAAVSAGVVTGLLAGTDSVIYTLTNACGTSAAGMTITVDPLPVAGSVSGTDSVCPGGTVTLSATVPGGEWSSSNTASATVDATGFVAGLVTGADFITYSVTNSCGIAEATFPVTVLDNYLCSSSVYSVSAALAGVSVYPNPSSSFITIESSFDVDVQLTTMDGRVVMSGKKAQTLDISRLPAANYLLGIYYAGTHLRVKTERVVKTDE
jgi:NHL repeat-containing protein/type IX secretion system substrate protein